MTPRDWTLLVIASSAQRVSPVQLQKALFLLNERHLKPAGKTDELYDFRPYDYGPFSSSIYDDAARLAIDGLVTISSEPGLTYRVYSPTAAGLSAARALTVSPEARSYVERLVQWVQSQSFSSLLRSVYDAFPEMATKSVFRR